MGDGSLGMNGWGGHCRMNGWGGHCRMNGWGRPGRDERIEEGGNLGETGKRRLKPIANPYNIGYNQVVSLGRKFLP